MLDKGVYYVVKRNLRREDRDEWASNIRSWCKNISSPREGKTVYIGTTFKDIHYTSESGEEKVIRNRIVYEMIERTSTPDGQLLLVPEIDINMFWTNLGDSDEDIIALYHAHGECEQFHSEIKTDMGVERLPSGKFDTNELVLELTVLAYNILRMIGQEAVRQGNAPAKRIVSTSFILPVMLLSTQDSYFFLSPAATLGLTVFSHSPDSSASLEFHGFRCKTITDKYNHCDEYSYDCSCLETAPEGNKNQRDNNARQCKNSKRYEQCPPVHVVCQ